MIKQVSSIFLLFFILAFIFLIFGCSLTHIPQGPPKKVFLKIFENQTVQYSLHTTLNEYLKDELLRESSLLVVDENEADYIINGKIYNYELRPMSYNMDNRVESYEEVIEVEYTLSDIINDENILNEKISENEIYFTIYGNSFETKSETELEKDAQNKILYFMARNIARKIVYADFNIKNNDEKSENSEIGIKNDESEINSLNNFKNNDGTDLKSMKEF
ncbi:MAG: LPS assembly lipoprotein LptE [Elusimicrobiota bacterium]|jgi:hypothetical protein|nr:LPS assembly lipoprotein LptE [Elusimicrobiota bacterium]